MLSTPNTGKVIFFGKTGAGKTSTINVACHLDLPTDNVVACTKDISPIFISQQHMPGVPAEGLTVIDTPGIAESQDADETYLPWYKSVIPHAAHIIWVLQGDIRVYRPDQEALKKLSQFISPKTQFTVGLNRIDEIGPGNWDYENNQPSPEQMVSINEKIDDVVVKISKVFPITPNQVIAYSAKQGFGIEELRHRILSLRRKNHV